MDPALMTPSDVLYEQNLPKFLELFSELLSRPKLSPSTISSTIVNNQTTAAPTALALSAYAAAKANPAKTEYILETVQSALDTDAVRAVLLTDDVEHIPEEVFYVFDREFSEHISEDIYGIVHDQHAMDVEEDEDEDRQAVEEEQTVVKATLVQTFAVRLGLSETNHHIRVARQGLGFDEPIGSSANEVLATATLVVFLALGAETAARQIVAKGGYYQGVFAALMKLRKNGILKAPSSLAALDRIILDVESRSNERKSAAEVWKTLFPGSVETTYN